MNRIFPIERVAARIARPVLRRVTEHQGRENQAWFRAARAELEGQVDAELDSDPVQAPAGLDFDRVADEERGDCRRLPHETRTESL